MPADLCRCIAGGESTTWGKMVIILRSISHTTDRAAAQREFLFIYFLLLPDLKSTQSQRRCEPPHVYHPETHSHAIQPP